MHNGLVQLPSLRFYALFYVCTFTLQAKHLQFVSGVHATSYWTATFLWDLISALLPLAISVALFAGFQIDAYTGDGLAAVFLLFVSSTL